MKETLRKSLRKLQTHEGLRNVDDDVDLEALIKDPADDIYNAWKL